MNNNQLYVLTPFERFKRKYGIRLFLMCVVFLAFFITYVFIPNKITSGFDTVLLSVGIMVFGASISYLVFLHE